MFSVELALWCRMPGRFPEGQILQFSRWRSKGGRRQPFTQQHVHGQSCPRAPEAATRTQGLLPMEWEVVVLALPDMAHVMKYYSCSPTCAGARMNTNFFNAIPLCFSFVDNVDELHIFLKQSWTPSPWRSSTFWMHSNDDSDGNLLSGFVNRHMVWSFLHTVL